MCMLALKMISLTCVCAFVCVRVYVVMVDGAFAIPFFVHLAMSLGLALVAVLLVVFMEVRRSCNPHLHPPTYFSVCR